MSEKKVFSVKFNEAQKEYSNDVLSKAKDIFGTETKGESLFKIIEQWAETTLAEGDPIQENLTPIPDQLEDMCALDFLQKIIDPKSGLRLWFCLKNQGPNMKGKPLLMADGKDRESIQKLCASCKTAFGWREERSKQGKATAAIKKFGDMPIDVILTSCIHPANNALLVNLGTHGTFYCRLKDDLVNLQRTCKPNQVDQCEYLYITKAQIPLKDTEGYKELAKQLEELK